MMAYEALKLASTTAVPTSCDAIYGHVPADIEDGGPVKWYYDNLIQGKQLHEDGEWRDNINFPVADVNAQCNQLADDTDYDATKLVAKGDQVDVAAITAQHKLMLYAHCLAQFQFASVGTDPWAGTFGIPLVGEYAGPSEQVPYPFPEGMNRTIYVDYNVKTRFYLGLRFGLSIWAYVPMLLCSCYLCGDAIVLFFAEATLPDVLAESNKLSANQLSMTRDSLVMAATSKTARSFRFTLALLAALTSWIFYLVFVVLPWGFVYTRMPRPFCEAGEPDHVNEWGFLGTTGGWKADWDATWYEYAIIVIQAFVLFAEGIVTAPFCGPCNRLGNRKTNGMAVERGIVDDAKFVTNKAAIRRFFGWVMYPLIIGVVVLIAGQAVSGARFGMAWAEGVVGQTMHTDELTGVVTPAFDPVSLSAKVYDQTIATLAITVACGLVTGVAMQRHLINGVGCFSATLFFGWLALVAIFALPLLIYANVRSVFNEDEANKDCASFPDTGYDFSKTACEARFWTFISGGVLVLVTLVVMTIFGLIEAMGNILKTSNKALVRIKKFRGFHPIMRAGGPGAGVTVAPYDDQSEVRKQLLGGFRSADEPFFNFKTSAASADDDANKLLYAPRIQLGVPVATGMPVSQR